MRSSKRTIGKRKSKDIGIVLTMAFHSFFVADTLFPLPNYTFRHQDFVESALNRFYFSLSSLFNPRNPIQHLRPFTRKLTRVNGKRIDFVSIDSLLSFDSFYDACIVRLVWEGVCADFLHNEATFHNIFDSRKCVINLLRVCVCQMLSTRFSHIAQFYRKICKITKITYFRSICCCCCRFAVVEGICANLI